MAEMKMQFKGWQAIVVVVALLMLVGYRFVSQKDMTGDAELVREVRQQLMYTVYPDQVQRLQAAREAGDTKLMEDLANKVSDTRLEVTALKASQPLFTFSSSREVVVRADYTLSEGGENNGQQTAYFLFEYHALGGTWRHVRSSTVISYYLNFL